jgi:sec-independent protein translocase protein TatC
MVLMHQTRWSIYKKEFFFRFFYLFISFLITFTTIFFFSDVYIYAITLLSGKNLINELVCTTITEAFFTNFSLCFFITFYFCLPFFSYSFFCFFIPTFYNYEKKTIIQFLFFFHSIFFFSFFIAHFFIVPSFFSFFLKEEIANPAFSILIQPRFQSYVNFCLHIYILTTISFFLPFFIFFLLFQTTFFNQNFSSIKSKRNFFIKRFNIFFFSFIIASILSPPDIFLQILISFFFLFTIEIGIIFLCIFNRYRIKRIIL